MIARQLVAAGLIGAFALWSIAGTIRAQWPSILRTIRDYHREF